MNQEENLVEEIFKKVESLTELNRVLQSFVWLIEQGYIPRDYEIFHHGSDAFTKLTNG